MLNTAKLHYLGIDLHSRGRRRVVVVCNWVVFFLGSSALGTLLDARSFSVRHPEISLWPALAYLCLFYYLSVFRDGGVIRPFHFRTLPLAGSTGRVVVLSSLDDWARYRHGAVLADLSEDQQQEILHSYRVGRYYRPADKSRSPERLDEREMMIRDRASASVLRSLVALCVVYGYTIACSTRHLQPGEILTDFFNIAFIALAGPASVILWNEPDPGETGDLAPVEAPSA